jgi:transposase
VNSMTASTAPAITIGVDTHKLAYVAVAPCALGEWLGATTIPASDRGYQQLLEWARALGTPAAFGVEGSGSYGQGPVRYLRRHDQRTIEVARPDRRDRRQRGKDDTLDAENAARAVLAGKATATPKAAEGTSEMIRQIKIARDTAVKSRTQAIIALKTLILTAPDELRHELQPLSKAALRDRCASLRPGPRRDPLSACKHALRSLARRWQQLNHEIHDHDQLLDELTRQAAPELRQAFGIGIDTTAETLILAGDNPERIRSDAAFAKLCRACPIPASSGATQRTGSTTAATDKPTAPSTAPSSSACAFTHPRSTTSNDAPPKAKASARSSAASSATSPARSTPRSSPTARPATIHNPLARPSPSSAEPPGTGSPANTLDDHRSINAVAETFFATLKKELINRRSWPSRLELQSAVFEYIEAFYNRQRRHSTLNMLSPTTYEQQHLSPLDS